MSRRFLGSLLFSLLMTADSAAYEPTDRYAVQDIEGWRVRVHQQFPADHRELADATLKQLRSQLYETTRAVPPDAVAKLRTIVIWVEHCEPHHPCMAYHPDAGWLREHGMNPDKARCVEIAGAENFLTWTRQQPWMVLHELAHGYHHQFLAGGYDHAELAAALERVKKAGLYDSVLPVRGPRRRAYALNNPMEFFAESSEAYFGTNDFYPFVRAELREHDPATAALLEKLWGIAPPGQQR